MHKDVKDFIEGFTLLAFPTAKQLQEIIEGWEIYFKRLQISEDHQLTEFTSIMRMRAHAGAISIVAPDIDKFLEQKEG